VAKLGEGWPSQGLYIGKYPLPPLFSLKSIIYAILSSAMLRENHAVFFGKKYRFPRGGGGE
jgi:hypothetical protein